MTMIEASVNVFRQPSDAEILLVVHRRHTRVSCTYGKLCCAVSIPITFSATSNDDALTDHCRGSRNYIDYV